jgi:EmrB/QacA subfamily drug resistance transporter
VDLIKNTRRKFTPWQIGTLAAVCGISFIISFSSNGMTIIIPAIASEFGSSAMMTGWIVTGYILACAALVVPIGRVADISGRRLILIGGIVIFSLFSTICAFSGSVLSLIVFRVFQGIGAAMIYSSNMATLIAAFPPERRGQAIGYASSAVYSGFSCGPVVGGFLNQTLGWRSIFFVTTAIGILAFILALSFLPKSTAHSTKGQLDIKGNILYILTVITIMYGFSHFFHSPTGKILVILGLTLGVFFVCHELRYEKPVIQLRMFSGNLRYSMSNIATFLNYAATFAVSYLISLYLQEIRNFDSRIAGLVLISQPLIMAFLSPLAGRLSDRISPFKIGAMGMGICSLGMFLFVFLSPSRSLLWVILNLALLGLGYAMFSSPNSNAIMSCVQPKDYSVASSIIATMRNLGQSSSMVILTLIVTIQMGNATFDSAPPEQLIKTMQIGFIVFTLLCIAGVFFSLPFKTKSK